LEKKYLVFTDDSEIAERESFIKDGTYMDPMRDILALFSNIPATENLMISFKYTYKEEVPFGVKLGKSILHILKVIW
jgi:hypothetical protein